MIMFDSHTLEDAAVIHEADMADPEYRAEYERTLLANQVAIVVIHYRAEHGLSQTDLARQLEWPQSSVSRLEASDHVPTLGTLARLATGLGVDLSVSIVPGQPPQLAHPHEG
jgi:ribosome-binding protein aMBF1 (putative translation factor)